MRNKTLKIKYDEKAAVKIIDVVKTRELQSDICKIFYVQDFKEFESFLDDDWHAIMAESFARQHEHRVDSAYDSADVYEILHGLAFTTLSLLQGKYTELHECFSREKDNYAFYEVLEQEDEFVRLLNQSFSESSVYLAYVVEGFLHPPAARPAPKTPSCNI